MFLKPFFEKVAKIWFWYKCKTAGSGILGWGYIYFKTPVGSEREKMAFRQTIELWAKVNNEVSKVYPDYMPPDILRKCAFGGMFVNSHNSFGILYRSAWNSLDGNPSKASLLESQLCLEKYQWWEMLVLSKPKDEKESRAISELKRLGEIFPHMVSRHGTASIEQ